MSGFIARMVRLLPVLDRKLVRDLWAIRGQALAIGLVVAGGVALFVTMQGSLRSLEVTQAAYYDRYRFADIWAPLKRAPVSLVDRIEALPGVARAIGRVTGAALVDVEGISAPVTARLLSLPRDGQPALNAVHMTGGRTPDPAVGDEVLALDGFVDANGLSIGDTLWVTLNGVRRQLTIVGTAISPEFVYAIPPGALVPDDRKFAVLWMGRRALANAYDMDGAFNEAVVSLQPGASEVAAIERLDRLLDRYGGTGAYARIDQISHAFLDSEIDQLRTLGTILPPVFLAVAAFLLNVVIGRLIDQERDQIGLLKAFGYTPRAVGLHYGKFVLAVTLLGISIGIGLGLWIGRGLAELYAEYYTFPVFIFSAGPNVYAGAVLASLAAAVVGAGSSVWRALSLDPAVAMRPSPPPSYRRGNGLFSALAARFDQPSRMIIRHLTRWPRRAGLTVLGIAAAMALLIGARTSNDSVERMMAVYFNLTMRPDMTLTLIEPRDRRALHEIERLPGVKLAEGYRTVPVKLVHGTAEERASIIGLPPGAELQRLITAEERTVQMPKSGLVVAKGLADRIGLEAGDTVLAEVQTEHRPRLTLQVALVVQSYIGNPVYIDRDALNRAMRETTAVTDAGLLIDSAEEDALNEAVKDLPMVASIASLRDAQRSFREIMDESLGAQILINTLFAGLIVVGVVYNAARISLAERSRELASLRVMGFTRAEVSFILIGELFILTVLALPLGSLLGHLLFMGIAASFDSRLFTMPIVFNPTTHGEAALIVLVAAAVSAWLVQRRINRLDLVAVLKTRE